MVKSYWYIIVDKSVGWIQMWTNASQLRQAEREEMRESVKTARKIRDAQDAKKTQGGQNIATVKTGHKTQLLMSGRMSSSDTGR